MTINEAMYQLEQAWLNDIPDNEMSQEEEELIEKIESVKDRMYDAEISDNWNLYDELEESLRDLQDNLEWLREGK